MRNQETHDILIYVNGDTGIIFLGCGLLLSVYFSFLAFSLRDSKSEEDAWKLFKFSNVYLYSLFVLLVIDTAYRITV